MKIESHAVLLGIDDIDTDQIIPARYLKVTDKAGLGDGLFADWRRGDDGRERPEFALNRPESRGARLLVVGKNFGCGSSREHAPWALCAAGFGAVIARGFADIFRNNALKNGLLPVALSDDDHARVAAVVSADPAARLVVDLTTETVTLPDGAVARFSIDPFARHCLLSGVDELGYLLSKKADIEAYEARTARKIAP